MGYAGEKQGQSSNFDRTDVYNITNLTKQLVDTALGWGQLSRPSGSLIKTGPNFGPDTRQLLRDLHQAVEEAQSQNPDDVDMANLESLAEKIAEGSQIGSADSDEPWLPAEDGKSAIPNLIQAITIPKSVQEVVTRDESST